MTSLEHGSGAMLAGRGGRPGPRRRRSADGAPRPVPCSRSRPTASPAIYLAGQSLGLQPRIGPRRRSRRSWTPGRRLGVDAWFDAGTAVVHAVTRRCASRWRAIVGALPDRGRAAQQPDREHPPPARLVLPAGRPATPDPDRRPALPVGSPRADDATWRARGLDPDARPRRRRAARPARRPSGPRTSRRPSPSTAATSRWSSSPASTSRRARRTTIERLTAAGHAAGAVVGWDLAHAAGNVELALHDWDVDFAAWCTYKYLNGGPGSVGAIFVHERHGRDASLPRLGRLVGDRSGAPVRHRRRRSCPAEGAAGWATSTSPILALAALAASLAIFDEVGMPALRARSVALTGYLERLLDDSPVEIITPARSGCPRRPALAPLRRCRDRPRAGSPRGASWPTIRAPDLVRVAPIPLYTTFHDRGGSGRSSPSRSPLRR